MAAATYAETATERAKSAAQEAQSAASAAQASIASVNESASCACEHSYEELAARVAELERAFDAKMTAIQTLSDDSVDDAKAAIAAAQEKAAYECACASRLAGQSWPQTGYVILTEDYPTAAILAMPDPLRYWPERGQLLRHGPLRLEGRVSGVRGQSHARRGQLETRG